MTIQVKLLRVSSRSARCCASGALKPRYIDVRFVRRDEPRSRRSRSRAARSVRHLYFRLNGITLVIPPLRERT